MYELFPQTKIGEDSKNTILTFEGVDTSKISHSEAIRLCDSNSLCKGLVKKVGPDGDTQYTFYGNIASTEYVNDQSTLYLKKGSVNYIFVLGVLLVMFLVYIRLCV